MSLSIASLVSSFALSIAVASASCVKIATFLEGGFTTSSIVDWNSLLPKERYLQVSTAMYGSDGVAAAKSAEYDSTLSGGRNSTPSGSGSMSTYSPLPSLQYRMHLVSPLSQERCRAGS